MQVIKMGKQTGRPGIDPMPRYKKACRAYTKLWQAHSELKEQGPPPVDIKRAPGRPPVPYKVLLDRAKTEAQAALQECRDIEAELGLPELTPAKIRAVKDYAPRRGRPEVGEVGRMLKEMRRLKAKLQDLKKEPAEAYRDKLRAWEKISATPGGRPGRTPLPKEERTSRVQSTIDELQESIEAHPDYAEGLPRLRVEWEQKRIERRNLSAYINQQAGTTHAAPDRDEAIEAWAGANRVGAQLTRQLIVLEVEIERYEEKIARLEADKVKDVHEENAALKAEIEDLRRRMKLA
jgi:hypothetical protein